MIRFAAVFAVFSLFGFQGLRPIEEYGFDARFETIRACREDKRVFVETGTAGGNGIYMSIFAGFEEIYSTEVDYEQYAFGLSRFHNEPTIHLFHDDSASALRKFLPGIEEPVLFWLDAHYCGNAPQYFEKCPVLRELAAIGEHPVKTHPILIDDMRLFGTDEFDGISVDDLIQAIRKINPAYEISFEDGFVPKDVLVAKIRSK